MLFCDKCNRAVAGYEVIGLGTHSVCGGATREVKGGQEEIFNGGGREMSAKDMADIDGMVAIVHSTSTLLGKMDFSYDEKVAVLWALANVHLRRIEGHRRPK